MASLMYRQSCNCIFCISYICSNTPICHSILIGLTLLTGGENPERHPDGQRSQGGKFGKHNGMKIQSDVFMLAAKHAWERVWNFNNIPHFYIFHRLAQWSSFRVKSSTWLFCLQCAVFPSWLPTNNAPWALLIMRRWETLHKHTKT